MLTKLLHLFPPETAHDLATKGLKYGYVAGFKTTDKPVKLTNNLTFKNPLGLAAGFDKNAECVENLSKLGFSHIEIGTVTPLPQPGNPKPRMFRLKEDQAIINRLGFNGKGHTIVRRNIEKLSDDCRNRIKLGINIGKNKTATDPVQDYVVGVNVFEKLADYLTINISSPNTPGLRDWQTGKALAVLLDSIVQTRQTQCPLFLKIAPDLDDEQLSYICEQVQHYKIDGLIISNTTISRPNLLSQHAIETGGLSGKPLLNLSTNRLSLARKLMGDTFPIIAVGGVMDKESYQAKLSAGATAVQAYTGFIYKGLTFAKSLLQ